MKTYSIFFQGVNADGVVQFDTVKYKAVKFDPVFLIEHLEKKFELKSVQINHYIEVIKPKEKK